MVVARKYLIWLCFTTLLAQPAWAQCRQALVLALDVSGSVSLKEYRQQLDGLADALMDPSVTQLILDSPETPVALMAFEWSSRNHQIVIQPWVFLKTLEEIAVAAHRIRTLPKQRAGLKTALGTALSFAGNQLQSMQECWRLTVDVSADGQNNIGPTPRDAMTSPIFRRTTVNALIVSGQQGSPKSQTAPVLEDYFQTEVIQGDNAFTIVADGYADYARAMRIKLIKELQPVMLSRADPVN